MTDRQNRDNNETPRRDNEKKPLDPARQPADPARERTIANPNEPSRKNS